MICWGIDPGANRLAVAVIESDSRELLHVETIGPVGKPDLPEDRVGQLHNAARRVLGRMADDWPPAVVVVEKPAGRVPSPTLMAGWTVATLAAQAAARDGGIVLWQVPQAWRKAAGMRAYVDPPPRGAVRAREWKAAAALQAADVGYAGSDIDERDAVCIALAAAAAVSR